jgi:hypothetical protein
VKQSPEPYVLRIKGYWPYIVRQSGGEVVLRTQDTVYARRTWPS